MIAHDYGEVLLKVEGVSLALGGRPVLREVSLEVRDLLRPNCTTGQVVGLLGPSGIGKTQLFRVLAGLQRADEGSVKIGAAQRPVRAGEVGVVAQDCPLFNHRTVLDNLLVTGASLQRARELLERFGLAQVAKAWPQQLSGGQRQRVAIAQQVLCSEHFLLMDEPFSGLDPLAVDDVCALISEVASLDTRNTIIVVTHDITAAARVADHLWLLGRDRDGAGQPVPGARVQRTIDLIARDIAFVPEAISSERFRALVAEVHDAFRVL